MVEDVLEEVTRLRSGGFLTGLALVLRQLEISGVGREKPRPVVGRRRAR